MEKLANFNLEQEPGTVIKIVGVGGGGGNAVNHMHEHGIRDVGYMICNTDAQAMENSPIRRRVQLGATLTEGRGAGNKPETGRQAAIENIEDVKKALEKDTKMVFITAGMGGGTGTGAAPVIAQACHEKGYLTVAIVTIPFRNEGRRRIKQAYEGIKELEKYVDSLLVINNERIREMYGDFGISEAFLRADNILSTAAKGIAEIITVPGYINVDFADVETVMRKSGMAVMGTGVSLGPNRAEEAVELALNSPLLNNNDIRGARNVLVHITSGEKEVTMSEIGQITDYIQNKAGFDADLIWGNGFDESLDEELSVTVIATGFPNGILSGTHENSQQKERVYLSDDATSESDASSHAKHAQGHGAGQKTFEFDIKKEREIEDMEFENLYPNTSRKRTTQEKQPLDISDFSSLSEEDMDDLDKIPAYRRRQIRMNDPKFQKKPSKYSVNRNNQISDRNSYLHDKVD
ncbi:cell division protein FtsZ [Maribellus sp. YY47]|uniref:cell division protein FtsZ n=1 Tax=Maribellus sp. YY47 TaxID=2929486 RepID=UPI00200065DC|nr:cell division protein FtsZ [Maribellus sp. YY47]MCK3685877.1 cell division protein FtsZ [Maribellus sp. YY47]